VIDEEGKLLGIVNVVDLFVVLSALVLVVGGVAVVAGIGPLGDAPPTSGNGSDTPDTGDEDPANLTTRYATVNLGSQPWYVVEEIQEGDEMSVPNAPDNLTVTDVYVMPRVNEPSAVFVRVRLQGRLTRNQTTNLTRFTFAGNQLSQGSALQISTEGYTRRGRVLGLDDSTPELPTSERSVVTRTRISREEAAEIERGDTYELHGQTLATIERLTVYPTDSPDERLVILGLDVRTLDYRGGSWFAARPLRLNTRIPFETDSYNIGGEVVHRGDTTLPGEVGRTTVTVQIQDASPELAESISVGMTESFRGVRTVEVVDRRVEPASIIVTSEDGNVYEREHPRNKDVSLTLELRTRRTDEGLQFRGQPLVSNERIILYFDGLTVGGTIIEIQED